MAGRRDVIKRQELFTIEELCAVTGYSNSYMWRHVATDKNPDRPLKSLTKGNGRAKRITRDSIEKWYRAEGALAADEYLPDDWGMDLQFAEEDDE